jgi:hypothetical protein
VGTRPPRRRDRAPPDLRHAAHLRDLEPRRRRVRVCALATDGNLARDIDATYGHLAADAERVEIDLLDAYDATCGRGLATGMSED